MSLKFFNISLVTVTGITGAVLLFIFHSRQPKKASKKVNEVSVRELTLKKAYQDYFTVGAAIGYHHLIENKLVAKFMAAQYASITPENELKPTRLEAKEGMFTWQQADSIVGFAMSNQMKVRGHTLVWPYKMPAWMYRNGNALASKEQLLERLKKYIQTVVSRYKGRIYCWDVVNEAIAYIPPDKLDSRTDTLYQIAGEEYIEKAFVYAHQADPEAKLFYNDNGEEWSKKRDKIFHFLKKMKERGIPIHGVGFQSHLGIEGLPENYLKETIRLFSSIGLEVQLTERDISIYPKRIKGKLTKAEDLVPFSDAYTKELREKQAAMYEMVFRVCRENKDKVTGITLWSGYDWRNYLTVTYHKKNYPYLFDEQLRPKKAFDRVVDF